MADKLYNTHTIAINIGNLPEEETKEFIHMVHKMAEGYIATVDPKFEGARFYTNTPVNASGFRLAKTYYWVEDARIYHVLTGKNPDGTERVMRTLDTMQSTSDLGDWADDEMCYVTTKLEPLVEIPKLQSGNGKSYYLAYEPAYAPCPHYGYSKQKLVCSRVDGGQIDSETSQELCKIFRRYCLRHPAKNYVKTELLDGKLHVGYTEDASHVLIMTKIMIVDGVTFRTDYEKMTQDQGRPKSNTGSPRGRGGRRGRGRY